MSVRRQGAVFHCNKLDLSRTKELSFVEHALKETLHIHAQNVVKKLLGYVSKILASHFGDSFAILVQKVKSVTNMSWLSLTSILPPKF